VKSTTFSRAGNALFWQIVQFSGTKVIFLVRLLVLARLLSPDDFGLLAIASIAIDVLMVTTDFGMVPALIQRPEADEKYYHVAWTVGLLRALSIALVTILVAPIFARLFNEPRASLIIQALAIRPLIDSLASIKVAELTRNLRFRSLALIELPKALANTVVAVALAPWLGVWALVAGTLAGPIAYLIVSYLVAPYRPRLSFDFVAGQSLIRYGRWVFLTGLVAMIGQSMLRLVIGRQLGAAELGLYYLAASLAFMPADIASQVVGKVAFPFYSRLQTDVRQASLAFRSVLTSLYTLLLPALALLIALAPSLVESVLGPRWEGTAPIIRVLALTSLIGLLGDMIVPVLQGTGQPDKILVIEGIQSSLLIAFVWGMTEQYGLLGAALAWLLTIIISQIVAIVILRQILPQPFSGLGLRIGIAAAISIVAAAAAISVDHIIYGSAGFISASALGVAITGSLLWILERRYSLGLSDGFVRAFPQFAAIVGLTHR
jgi:O-antigen/teichoic acid export membrane protein